jgi:polar amino acid transport system substrate-binding protein
LVLLFCLNPSLLAETLKIATGEYPPWTTESLPHNGYINQIVESAFKVEGLDVEFHFMPWKRALEATRLGHFHATSYWGDKVERHQEFYHSDVLHTESFVFFHRKSLSPLSWKKLSDLSAFAIGATRGYTYTVEFWAMANEDKLRVSVADDDVANLRRLVEGQIDLFPLSLETGKYLLKQHFTAEQAGLIDVNLEPMNFNKDFILFSRQIPGNEKYLEAFNRGLKQLQRENKLAPIRKAALSQD